MKFKILKKEWARDFLALGSWVFYFLVVGRALIKFYRPFTDQILIAGLILLVLGFLFGFISKKYKYEGYIARGLVLVVFTIIFYNHKIFTWFAILVFIGMLISSYIVGNSKRKILLGAVIGGVVSRISYYLSEISVGIF